MAFLLEKNQENEPHELFEDYLWITQDQIELLNNLRSLQTKEEDRTEGR
jgi:hypothetical protein